MSYRTHESKQIYVVYCAFGNVYDLNGFTSGRVDTFCRVHGAVAPFVNDMTRADVVF